MRVDHTALNFAVVRYIVLSILKSRDDKMSDARHHKHFAFNNVYLEKVIRKIQA